MKARVLSVYDEGSLPGTPLIGAKGFSVLVDVDDQRILFSTGRRGNYLMHNLGNLDVTPDSISSVVLSHGHRDHTGGLNQLLEEREDPVKVYAHKDIWVPRAGRSLGLRRDIGAVRIMDEFKEKVIVEDIEGWTKLTEHLYAMQLPPMGPDPRFMKLTGDEWVNDTMEDEIALVIIGRKGPVLICGCCHTGIGKAMAKVKEITGKDVHAVIGGIHTVKMKNPQIDPIAAELQGTKTPLLYLNHCTTPTSVMRLRTHLGLNAVRDFYVGTDVQFEI